MERVKIQVGNEILTLEVPDGTPDEDIASFVSQQQPASSEAVPPNSTPSPASGQPASVSPPDLAQLAPPTGPTTLSPEQWSQVEQTAKGLPPMGLRIGGAIGGNVAGAGALLTGNIPGAIAARTLIPAGADLAAQGLENVMGTRDGINPWRTAAEVGAAQIAGTGLVRGGLTGLGVNEITSQSEGHTPSWDERLWATVFGSAMGAVAKRSIKSPEIQSEAEELMRLKQMEEAANDSVTGHYQAELMPERPALDLPRAEASKVEEGSVPKASPVGIPQQQDFYHGTRSDFPEFSRDKFYRDGTFGPGIYVTDNPEYASVYATEDHWTKSPAYKDEKAGPNVRPTRISPKNVFDATKDQKAVDELWKIESTYGAGDVPYVLKARGYDAVKYHEYGDVGFVARYLNDPPPNAPKHTVMLIFDPENVKSKFDIGGAEYASMPKHIQDDFDELNAKLSAPEEGPDKVNPIAIRDIIGGGPPAPRLSGDQYSGIPPLQLTDTRPKFKRGWRSDAGLAPMIEDVARMDTNARVGAYADHRELRKADQQLRVFKDSFIRDGKEPVYNQKRRGAEWIFTGTNQAKRKQYTGWLEAKDKEAFEQANGFTNRDKIAVRSLRLLYNDLFKQFGIDGDLYHQNYAPHIKRYNAQQMQAFLSNPEIPAEYKFFAEMMRTGEMTQYEDDALLAFSEYLNRGSFKKFMAEPWQQLYDKYRPLAGRPDPFSGHIDLASNDPATREVGEKFIDMLEHYRYRKPDAVGKTFENIAGAINGLTKKITGREGRLTRHDMLGALTQAQTAGLLAGRPKAVVQNAAQVITIAGSRLNPKWLARGIKAANTPEGRAIAQRAGVTTQGIQDMAELHSISTSRLRQGFNKAVDTGMKPFTKVEDWGRTVVYNGQHLKTLAAARKAKNVDEFLSFSDADMMPEPVQQMLKVSYMAGNFEKAADDAADYMVQSTLYDYGALGRPSILRKEGGRLVGSYGVWPMNYISFVKGLFKYGPKAKRARDFGQFLALNGAMAAIMAGGKQMFNSGQQNETQQADLMSQYVWPAAKEMSAQTLAPMAYTGGPVVEAVTQAGAVARGTAAGYDTTQPMKRLTKVGKAFVPFNKAAGNFMDAYRETDGFRQRPVEGIGQLFEMTDDGRIRRQQQMMRAASKVRTYGTR